jgi:hypothetical protein
VHRSLSMVQTSHMPCCACLEDFLSARTLALLRRRTRVRARPIQNPMRNRWSEARRTLRPGPPTWPGRSTRAGSSAWSRCSRPQRGRPGGVRRRRGLAPARHWARSCSKPLRAGPSKGCRHTADGHLGQQLADASVRSQGQRAARLRSRRDLRGYCRSYGGVTGHCGVPAARDFRPSGSPPTAGANETRKTPAT